MTDNSSSPSTSESTQEQQPLTELSQEPEETWLSKAFAAIKSTAGFLALAAKEWLPSLINQPIQPPMKHNAAFEDEWGPNLSVDCDRHYYFKFITGSLDLFTGRVEVSYTLKSAFITISIAFLLALLYRPFAFICGVRIKSSAESSTVVVAQDATINGEEASAKVVTAKNSGNVSDQTTTANSPPNTQITTQIVQETSVPGSPPEQVVQEAAVLGSPAESERKVIPKEPVISMGQVFFVMLYTFVPWLPIFAFVYGTVSVTRDEIRDLLLMAPYLCVAYVIINFAMAIKLVTNCSWKRIWLSLSVPIIIWFMEVVPIIAVILYLTYASLFGKA